MATTKISTLEKDDVVLVEHADVTDDDQDTTTAGGGVKSVPRPEPLQIVSIGTEDDQFAFKFHEDKLNTVMRKIPPGWKVAVISVVGAFRTGKSFLLSWFLTYLQHLADPGELVDEDGNDGAAKKWFESAGHVRTDAFHWRGGAERNTTGIWMWSVPHFVTKRNGESLAVLLVDSQGMFDNETTMSLTASIFGLSTLLSSYQIYNVEKRIQEDNLQQLALFSEYARLAVQADNGMVEQEKTLNDKPFQTMEFLVRDWQNFEDEEDFDRMEREMEEYLEKVISTREAKDLQDTREQIFACFAKLSCFGLTYPGKHVVKTTYQGEVSKMDETFLILLDRYCRRVFSVDNLQAKIIQGREVTAAELGTYIKAYAEMFASGASFPEASTMLEATAYANNTNAVNIAIAVYKDYMSRISGPKCTNYIRPGELQDDHRQLLMKSLDTFDSMATFGNKRDIEGSRQTVLKLIEEEFEVYASLNEGRNPLSGMEIYIIPLSIAFVAYLLRGIADLTCSSYSQTCRNTSDLLSHIFGVVIIFMMIVGATKAKQLKDLFQRVKGAVQLLANEGGGKQKGD